MTDDQLRALLATLGTLSEVVLQTAGWAWAALEARGVDLSDVLESSPYFFARVRDVAHGKLVVEAAMKFGGRTYILDAVRKLPPRQQEQLSADDRVPFVVRAEDGTLTERRLHLAALEREQVKQLINDRGEIRTPNQQIAYLSPSPAQPAAPTRDTIRIARGKLYLPADGEKIEKVIAKLRQAGCLPAS
jgi:hypothetical protein